jgi:hypothetical protein
MIKNDEMKLNSRATPLCPKGEKTWEFRKGSELEILEGLDSLE